MIVTTCESEILNRTWRDANRTADNFARIVKSRGVRYLETNARGLGDVGAATKSEPASTQPAMPEVLSRRHVPFDSPSCTREFGPTDATIRALLLGPARTTTQPFATDATHRDDVSDLVDDG